MDGFGFFNGWPKTNFRYTAYVGTEGKNNAHGSAVTVSKAILTSGTSARQFSSLLSNK